MGFDWVTNFTLITLLIGCGLLVVQLCKKYDVPSLVRRFFFPHRHEYVAKKWIDKGLNNVSIRAKLTEGALEFIKTKSARESSLLISLRQQFVGSRKGPYPLPFAEIRLGVADPSEDFVKVESNAGIPVLVVREIYEVFKQQRIPLVVTTSGLWRFKRLDLRGDLSWLLYSKEEMRRRRMGWPGL